jgi:hypothetical protein
MKSLPFMLCIGVLSLCRLTFAQNPSPGETAIPSELRRTNLIQCLEEPGGHVDRPSHDRSKGQTECARTHLRHTRLSKKQWAATG